MALSEKGFVCSNPRTGSALPKAICKLVTDSAKSTTSRVSLRPLAAICRAAALVLDECKIQTGDGTDSVYETGKQITREANGIRMCFAGHTIGLSDAPNGKGATQDM